MTHSRVATGGDGLQIWMVATNILNKQSQKADNGWSSTMLHEASVLKTSGGAGHCEHGNEPSGSIKGGEFLPYLSDN